MKKNLLTLGIATILLWLLAPGAWAADWPTPSGPDGTGFLSGTPTAKTHSLRWSTKISDLPSGIFPMSPLLVYQGRVYVNGAGTDSVLALDATNGEVVWRFSPDPRATGAFGGYPAPNEPWISKGIYYTSATNGFVYALDAATGRKVWSYRLSGNEYTKAIAKVSVCDGKVYADTVGGIPSKGQHNLWALNAASGAKVWSTYVGAPDWPGEGVYPDFPTNPTPDQLAALGRSTRRFEARPGVGCAGNRVHYFAEDGVLRVLRTSDGAQVGAYDILHHGMDLGFAVDGAAGITDPVTGDLLRNSLNNRLVRLDNEALETVCGGEVCPDHLDEQMKVHPGWRAPYGDCSSPSVPCGIATSGRGGVVHTYMDSRQDGVIGGAVFSGGIGLATWEDGKRVVYSANHDGYLYAVDFDSPITNGEPSVFKVPFGTIPASQRSFYTSNDGSNCATASRCQNGPWEHMASNVSGPAVAGGVVYVAGSMDHKMYGFDWKTGAKVFEYEIKWDSQSKYPPFGDTKPSPFVDLDELVQTTPAHDGGNLYFAANNGVVYSISTQQTIANPRRNLAILGSGVVPFIPKWTEALGAFDYVWTPQGDWYHPSYVSQQSTTAAQSAPGFEGGLSPFGYQGIARQTKWWAPALLALVLITALAQRSRLAIVAPLSLDKPLRFGRTETLVESLELIAPRSESSDERG